METLDWYNEADIYRLAKIEASQCLMSEDDTKHIAQKRQIHHRVLTEHFFDMMAGDYIIFKGYCSMYNFEPTRKEQPLCGGVRGRRATPISGGFLKYFFF